MDCNSNYLFVISFVVGSESGVALVSAPSESDAKRLLMNSGSRNAFPDSYVFTQCRNLGMTVSIRNELLMESYVNALQAYTAICSMVDRMVIGGGSDPDAYHKPETGIPEYDLEESVQSAIELAKTALQSFTETDPLSVHTSQQSLSNAQKAQARSNINAQETLVSGVNIKTINDTSILGDGNIVIEGGGSSQNAVLYVEQELTFAQKLQARSNIGAQENRVLASSLTTRPVTYSGQKTFAVAAEYFGVTEDELRNLLETTKYSEIVFGGKETYNILTAHSDSYGDAAVYFIDAGSNRIYRINSFSTGVPGSTIYVQYENWSQNESTFNKVTSFSLTPSDIKYPSEKLVKDSLDTKYIKPSGGIPASDLTQSVQDALDTAANIFVAEYGVTSNADVTAAYNAGKAIFVKRNSLVASLYTYIGFTGPDGRQIMDYFFAGINSEFGPDGEKYIEIYSISSVGTWSTTSFMLQEKIDSSNKLPYSLISDTPTIPTVESMTAQEVTSAVDAAWNAVMS